VRFIDAHHHLWDLHRCHYPWLMAQGVKRFFGDPTPIQKNYLPADLLSESAAWTPEKSVHVQVGVEESQSVEETAWLQELANAPENRGIPSAIVAYIDLAAPDVPQMIKAHAAADLLRGARQIVGRHIDEDRLTGTDRLLADPAWRRGLQHLADAGLSFDLQMIPQQYGALERLLSTIDGLQVAICHCGSPWNQDAAGFAHWKAAMRAFARRPETCIKVSGLGMFKPDWSERDIRPWVLETIEIFSPRRVMFGSNFPVDSLYGSYQRIWSAYDRLTTGFSPSERHSMFHDTAARFYRI
jgi:predicted TIM-barrel fold metal-dependent hydrolase